MSFIIEYKFNLHDPSGQLSDCPCLINSYPHFIKMLDHNEYDDNLVHRAAIFQIIISQLVHHLNRPSEALRLCLFADRWQIWDFSRANDPEEARLIKHFADAAWREFNPEGATLSGRYIIPLAFRT